MVKLQSLLVAVIALFAACAIFRSGRAPTIPGSHAELRAATGGTGKAYGALIYFSDCLVCYGCGGHYCRCVDNFQASGFDDMGDTGHYQPSPTQHACTDFTIHNVDDCSDPPDPRTGTCNKSVDYQIDP